MERIPKIIKLSDTEFCLQIKTIKGEILEEIKFSEIFLNSLIREALRAISPTVKAVNPKSRMGGI